MFKSWSGKALNPLLVLAGVGVIFVLASKAGSRAGGFIAKEGAKGLLGGRNEK